MKKYLAAHHREKVTLKGVYIRLAKKFFREHFRNGAHQEEYDALRAQAVEDLVEVEEADIKRRLRFQFDTNHREELDAQYREYKIAEYERYLIVNEETAIVLCSICHFSREKGKVLCKECRKGYHDPRYSTCKTCDDKKK